MRYVYCHPLFDERKCAHRFSFQLKNEFQVANLALNRFDYRGTGESPGKFEDISLDTLREDVSTQVNSDEVSLVGLRFGASLAFDYCAHSLGTVRNLVLLEPIVDGAMYVDYLYRKQHIKNLMTGKSICNLQDKAYENLEGYKTSLRFIEQIKDLNLVELATEHAIGNSVFIIQISNRPKIEPRLSGLAKILEGSARRIIVENVKIPMFWERIPSTDYTELAQKVLRLCCG
jgi:pimeloyl-ACP methyl ester carboxylesterase